jgi:cysteine desulfurase/selenocysteine lyase
MSPTVSLAPAAFDVQAIRRDFPILRERVHDKPLVYLDNGGVEMPIGD